MCARIAQRDVRRAGEGCAEEVGVVVAQVGGGGNAAVLVGRRWGAVVILDGFLQSLLA